MSLDFRAPPYLAAGDTIALVAPAGPVPSQGLMQSIALLEKRYRVLCRDDITDQHHYLAGTDARRLAELQEAIDHPQVKAIVAMRGGFGSLRLLNNLNTDALQHHPKWLVGYSDITALHAQWACQGLRSIHAPMACELPDLSPSALESWFQRLESDTPIQLQGSRVFSPGTHDKAVGPLVGGNLATLASLVGTAHFPPTQGAVLLLEDVHEAPYRIDRMLTQLRLAGTFDQVAAVALGTWTNDASPSDDTVLEAAFIDAPFPVLAGLPVGHTDANVALPLGHLVEINTETKQLTGISERFRG